MTVNWLLSSAGRRGHLVTVLRAACTYLGGGSVIAIDASPLSAAGLLCDAFELVPAVNDPSFVCEVLRICKRHAISYILPTIDPELPIYAAARETFETHGFQVWISSPEVVMLGQNKWAFHQWLVEHHFASPRTFEARDQRARLLECPVIAKPRSGSASIGVVQATNVGKITLSDLGDDYIIQEHVEGYEVTIDFAVDRNGHLLGLGARRRLEVRAGEVSKAVTIGDPQLLSEVERFVDALPGAFGVLNVQVLIDDDNIYFIELNPRFGGGYPLSWQAGARFPIQLSITAAGPSPRVDARPGLLMLRYDQAVFAEAHGMLGKVK